MSDWKSENLDKIAPALLAAQQKLAPVVKEFRNPAFPKSKYADLNAVLDALYDAFHPHGLFLTQLPMPLCGSDHHGLVLRTVVMHTSGQWIASDLPMFPDMSNPQKVGACVTYGRRYGAVALAGLMQEDDDGETAVGRGHGHDYSRPQNGHAPDPKSSPRGENPKEYGPPTTGGALFAWAKKQTEQFGVDMVKWLDRWGQQKNLPGSFKEWSAAEIAEGHKAAVEKLNRHLLETAGKSQDND